MLKPGILVSPFQMQDLMDFLMTKTYKCRDDICAFLYGTCTSSGQAAKLYHLKGAQQLLSYIVQKHPPRQESCGSQEQAL